MKSISTLLSILFFSCLFAHNNDSIQSIFKQNNVIGSIVIYNLNNNTSIISDSNRCATRFTPASTFKIFNSLVALETNSIKDTNEFIPWDQVNRNYTPWNQSHTLKTAFKYSVVWAYQNLARRIGKERMQHYLDITLYGNQTIGNKVDQFWLDNSLKISSFEQIKFLKKLYHENLIFNKSTQKTVKSIMLNEVNNNYKLYAKTGWGTINKLNIGWFVGWFIIDENTYFFATNIQSNSDKGFALKRKKITTEVFKYLQLLP